MAVYIFHDNNEIVLRNYFSHFSFKFVFVQYYCTVNTEFIVSITVTFIVDKSS